MSNEKQQTVELSAEQQEALEMVEKCLENLQRAKKLIEQGSDLDGQLGALMGILGNEVENMDSDLGLTRIEKEMPEFE